MIEKIEIHNFQSHKATVLELDAKVNTLQGNSDCGKSAVLRALYWLIFNPAGDYFISDWARKGKTQIAPCEVIVHANGHKIVRRRDKDFNGYYLDDEMFEATRNTVPKKISDILNLGEVNVQRQLDPPFLLSMSAGEVSRYINNLVNLTRIDTWTSAANSRERKLRQDVDAAFESVENARKKVESYSFLPRLEELSDTMESLESRRSDMDALYADLSETLSRHATEVNLLESLPDVDRLAAIYSGLEAAMARTSGLWVDVNYIEPTLSEYDRQYATLESLPDVDRVSEILSAVPGMKAKADSLNREVLVLEHELDEHADKVDICTDSRIDELSGILSTLQHWNKIEGNIISTEQEIANDLANHDKLMAVLDAVDAELPDLMSKLDSMVCPLCGRRGFHEEYRCAN